MQAAKKATKLQHALEIAQHEMDLAIPLAAGGSQGEEALNLLADTV